MIERRCRRTPGRRLECAVPLVVLSMLGCRPFPLSAPVAAHPSAESAPNGSASAAFHAGPAGFATSLPKTQPGTDEAADRAIDASRWTIAEDDEALPTETATVDSADAATAPRVARPDLPDVREAIRGDDAGLAFLVVDDSGADGAPRPFEAIEEDAEFLADLEPLAASDFGGDDGFAAFRQRTMRRDGEVAPAVWDPLDSLGAPDAVFGPDDSADVPARWRISDDLSVLWPTLKADVRSLPTWQNAGFLAVGLGTALAFRPEVDGQVRAEVARHPQRWGEATETLGRCANVEYQVPVIFAAYGASLWIGDERLHSCSTSAMSALTVTGLTTLLIKGIADTDRPSNDWNDGHFGFPSYHTSSSFALAAVADEHYGPWVGVPAYLAAGLIGWSRIDAQDHDLSDVVFGAFLGYTIGKTIAHHRLTGDSHWQLLPLSLSNGQTTGLAAAWDY